MFVHFFLSVQQDIKLWIFFPILCAVFRAIFIAVHKPYSSLTGKKKALRECFRFGFWWGMDLNAYVFVISLVLVTLPGLFNPWGSRHGDAIRTILGLVYAFIIYVAFVGKMIYDFMIYDLRLKLLLLMICTTLIILCTL